MAKLLVIRVPCTETIHIYCCEKDPLKSTYPSLIAGSDYMTDSNFSRHFMATDFPLCFNVEFFEDSLFEGNETFNLRLQTVNSFITLNPSSALFTIYNTVSPYSLMKC